MSEISIGLIGFGRWGKKHIEAVEKTSGARIQGVAAQSPETCREAAALYNIKAFTDYKDLLKEPGIDAVIIAAPNYLHFPMALDALKSGKHVLVEKPMSFTALECNALILEAKRQQKVLYVGHEFRQFSIWQKLKQSLDEGIVGKPLFGDIQLWRYPYRSGSGGWKQDISKVGNWLLEEPVHYFDLACWFFSQSQPHSLYARASSRSDEKSRFFENFSCLLDYGNGSYVNITRVVTSYNFEIGVRITGTEGILKASWKAEADTSLTPQVSLTSFNFEEKIERQIEVNQLTGHAFELQNQTGAFVDSIQTGKPPVVNGEDGRLAVLLCEAALQSLEKNEIVKLF